MKALNLTTLIRMIERAYDELSLHKEEVNILNVFPVPDGDTGINMVLTLQSSVNEIMKTNPLSIKDFSLALRRGSLMGARGNSGVILSQIFLGFTQAFDEKEEIDNDILKKAFKQGTDVAYRAVMRPVEGTMLTIIKAMSNKAQTVESNNIEDTLIASIEAGEEALKKTPDLLPVLKEAGVVDAGGLGLIYVFKGMLKAFDGKKPHKKKVPEILTLQQEKKIVEEELEYLYCTELLINNPKKTIAELEQALDLIGGSLLVVGDESLIKLHMHTNDPDKVLMLALNTGEIQDIKIDNMRIQHGEYIIKNHINHQESKKEWGIVVVAQGKGLEEIFKNNGADMIIPGGQTMNPSVEQIITTLNKLNTNKILFFVNNKNITLAAEEAIKYIEEKEVCLVKTTHMIEGINALLRFNPDVSPEENLLRIDEARKEIQIIDITKAQRDGSMNSIYYSYGDYIALFGKDEIIAVSKDLRDIVVKALEKLNIKNGSLITIYAGEDLEEDSYLKEELSRKFNAEVEWYYGGQPHYLYYISIE